eukprot:s75_g27.t1
MSLTSSVLAFFCSELILLRGLLEVVYPIFFFHWVLSFTSPLNQKTYMVRFFKSRVMRFLGDISMCSYMRLGPRAVGYTIDRSAGDYPWWMVLAIVPSTIVLGWCFTTFYEKPIARCIRPDKRARRDVMISEIREHQDAHCPEVIGSPVEVKFTRPFWLTRRGFPNFPRSNPQELGPKGQKYCNMSKIHQQEAQENRRSQDLVPSSE